MNVYDVVLETEDLLVLGPVSNVELSVDIGPTGTRGARYIVGSGDPNLPGVIPEGEDIQVGDYFINSSTSSRYGWLYVFQAGVNNVTSWQEAIRLQPSVYSNNIRQNFENGLAKVSILISEITPDSSARNTDRYIVQITPISAEPMLLTLQQKIIVSPYSYLDLNVRALKFVSNTWVPISEEVTLGVTITVV